MEALGVPEASVIGASALADSTRPLADVMAHVLGGRAEVAVAAIAEQIASNPSGEKRCTSGPANNRSTSIKADVYTSTQPGCSPIATICISPPERALGR